MIKTIILIACAILLAVAAIGLAFALMVTGQELAAAVIELVTR